MIGLLINLVVLLLIFGIIWWVIGLLPIAEPFKTAIIVIGALILILILLSMIGLFGDVGWPVGRTLR